MKKLSIVFLAAAIILSDAMCAVVAYNYCALEWGGKYAGWSAPEWVAFLYAVPFLLGIILCAVLAVVFNRKSK